MKLTILLFSMVLLNSCGSTKTDENKSIIGSSNSETTMETNNSAFLNDAVGTWNMVVQSPRGEMENVLTISEENGTLTGKTKNDTFGISQSSNTLTWDSSLDTPMGSMQATYSATINGNKMQGKMKMTSGMMSGREMDFTATKQ